MRSNFPRTIGLLAQQQNGMANPSYTAKDFYSVYPQFFHPSDEPGEPIPIVPPAVMQIYVNLAHSCISYAIFRDAWFMCMGLFIAHWLALYLQTADDPLAGDTTGLISSKSVDGVSVSYDNNAVAADMEGFGMYKATSYGEQLVTFAKMMGLGGLYVR